MNKRVICLLLSLLLLLSLIPSAVSPVFAASDMAASEDCVAVLKKMEGFSKYPVHDYSQYSVGYGTACPEDKLATYRSRGITETEAEELLRTALQNFETSINRFAHNNNLKLKQNQFDALLMFTYNVGTSWLTGNSDLKDAVLHGATGNDLIYYMSRWCTADYQVLPGLIKRRLAEAELFLNGNYSAESPSHYSYVSYEPDGGVCTSRVQGYDASDPAAIKAIPTRAGYRFLGWYTELEGGQWITDLDVITAETTIYAHWQPDEDVDGEILGTPCEYKRRTNSASTLSVYETPNSAKPFAQLDPGIHVKIVADYVDSAGAKWGRMAGGGWINLGTTHQILHPAAKTVKTNVTVTVTSNYVHVRSGAGTSYDRVGRVEKGDKLVISETKLVGNTEWGYYSGGWISLEYTDYASEADGTTENAPVSGLSGTVVNCNSLRVRSGPGMAYVTVGQLSAGTVVEITQTQSVGASVWGKVSNGWISLSYVQLHEQPSAEPEEDKEATTGESQIGTVINCTKLNVRSGAGTGNKLVSTIPTGNRVVIYETKMVGSVKWARIDQGWVSMEYIQLDYSGSEEGKTGQVSSGNSALNVRSGAGSRYPKVTSLENGTIITIYETTEVNGTLWGRIRQGWICMDYVKLGTETQAIVGTVVGASSLRIRQGAGTSYPQVGTLASGTQVKIYETTGVNGIQWGRTDQGWICMSYIRTEGAETILATVTADSLRIRSAAGTTNDVVGSYNYGTQVEILETKQVGGAAWGRTNQGWICMSYVK